MALLLACQVNVFLLPVESSLANNRHGHNALTRPHVALDQEDLLPGAKHKAAVFDWHSQAGAEQGGLKVGMTVAVVPGFLVSIVSAGRDEPVQHCGQVFLEAGLELDCPQGGRAANIAQARDALLNSRVLNDLMQIIGQVVHIAMSARATLDAFLVHHE
jgi:hypothetical protein